MKLQVDWLDDAICVTVEGQDCQRFAEALDRCRNLNQSCPIKDLCVEQDEEKALLLIRGESPESLRKIGIDKCLQVITRKMDEA